VAVKLLKKELIICVHGVMLGNKFTFTSVSYLTSYRYTVFRMPTMVRVR
jgi:hypothetical protein